MPLDPAHLTPSASLNRMPLLPLLGVPLDVPPGTPAFDVLGAHALAAAVAAQADALGLDTNTPDLLRGLDACLTAPVPAVRATADAIARTYAGHLAHLLLTLLRGEPASRAARADWDTSYWAHWATIRQIWLGGGLVSGHLGPVVAHEVNSQLAARSTSCTVQIPPYAALLPLIGAARSAPPDAATALVWDFGQTAIKHGLARYHAGALAALQMQPPLPSGLADAMPPEALGARMVDVLVAGWAAARAAGATPAPVLTAAIAAYLRDGQPLTRQGGPYSTLNTLSPNLASWLSAAVSAQAGHALTVQLIHDGTAAGRACAGQPAGAVITLGTALGVGFPPPSAAVRPLAPGFAMLPPH